MNFQFDTKNTLRAPTNFGDAGLSLADRGTSFTASVADSWDTMSGAIASLPQNWYAGHLDKKNGLEPVSKDTIKELEEKGFDLGIKDDEKVYPTQLALRKNKFIRDIGRSTRINDRFAGTNFVGSMLPELVNPVNFVPFGRAVSVAKRATTLSKVGLPTKAAIAKAQGKKFTAARESFKDVATDALIGNVAVEPLYYFDAKYRGREYTIEDSALNIGLGTALGAGFFGTIAAGFQFRETGRFTHSAQQFEELYSFLETGQFGRAANVAYQNSASFRKAIERDKLFVDRVERAAQTDGIVDFRSLDDRQMKRLDALLHGHYTRSLQDALTKRMTQQILEDFETIKDDVTIQEFSMRYRDRYAKVMMAFETNDFSKLSKEELSIAEDLVGSSDNLYKDREFYTVDGERIPFIDPETGEIIPEPQENIFQRPIPVGGGSVTDAAFGPDFVVQSPNADHLLNRFKTALASLKKAGKNLEANRLSEITEDLEEFVESPTDFKALSYLTREITNAEYTAGIVTDAQRPIRPFTGDFDVDKRGFWGEQVSMFASNSDTPLKPKEGYVYRGVTQEGAGYTIDKEGNLVIRPRRDDMFTRLVGEEEGLGSSYSKDPVEAAHYALFNNLQEYRLLEEESMQGAMYDPSDEIMPPVILEIKAEALQKNPALRKVLEGTESESRLVHSEEIKLSKDDFEVYTMDTELHGELLAAPDEGVLTPKTQELKIGGYEFDLQSMHRARQEALRFQNILFEEGQKKRASIHQAVEDGVISAKEANNHIRKFEKVYGKAYKRHVALANEVINNIFGLNVTLKSGKDRFALGFHDPRDNIFRTDSAVVALGRMDLVLAFQDTSGPFRVTMHEMIHALKRVDPDSYEQILAAINKHPRLVEKLDEYAQGRGYEAGAVSLDEVAPVLFEWAITQKEFWQELQKSNKTLFVKLRDSLRQLFKNLVSVFKEEKHLSEILSRKNMKKLLSDDTTPAELARELGALLNRSREQRLEANKVLEATEQIKQNIEEVTRVSDPIPEQASERYIRKHKFSSVDDSNFILEDQYIQGLEDLYNEVTQGGAPEGIDDFLKLVMQNESLFKSGEDMETRFPTFKEFTSRIGVSHTKYMIDETTVGDALRPDDYRALYENLKEFQAELMKATSPLKVDVKDPTLRRLLNKAPKEDAYNIVKEYYRDKAIVIANDAFLKTKLLKKLDEFKTPNQKLKFLRTFLDGQERKGILGEEGLENKMISESQAAAIPLLDVLFQYDLIELFMPDGAIGFFKAFTNKNNRAKWRMFGKNSKEASKQFHKELHQALIDRKLPKEWEGVEGLTKLFDVLQATEYKLLKDLNRAGIRIGMIEDFGGVSQKWDVDIIKGMTKEAFVDDLRLKVDVEKTREALGGKMTIDGKEVDFELTAFLGAWYDRLISEKRVAEDVQVLDLEDVFESRAVRIKTDEAVDVALKYSGYDSIGHLILQQIQRRASLATLARNGGTRPNKLLKEVADLADGSFEYISESGSTVQKPSSKSVLSNKGAFVATLNKLTGILENPVDVQVSRIGDFIQKIGNLMFLSGSGLSSLTDIPLIASTLEMQGIKFADNNKLFWETWQQSMERKFSDPKAMKAYFLGMGAGFDIINNAVIRRLSDTTERGGWIDRLNNLLFKVNGLNAFTATHQEMFVDILTRGLADELGKPPNQRTPELVANLEEFGFTAKEMDEMGRKAEKGPDGVLRVDPRNLSNTTADKLRKYMTKYMRQAVIVPDIGTKAQFTGGFRKGTLAGESARVVTQYQPFMAAMTKLLYRRFMNGSFGKETNSVMMYKMAHFVAYAGTALAFGYMVTVLKDLARGKQPMFLDSMTPFGFSRVVSQSGLLGILQVPVDVARGGPIEAVAPAPATILGLIANTATGDIEGAFKDAQQLTGSNIHGVPQILHGQIAEVFTEALNQIQLNELDNLEDQP